MRYIEYIRALNIELNYINAIEELKFYKFMPDTTTSLTLFENETAFEIPPEHRMFFMERIHKFFNIYLLSCDIFIENKKEYLVIRRWPRDIFRHFLKYMELHY